LHQLRLLMTLISEFAPAKINLSLKVGKLRHDGFHSLDSLVAFAEIGDELTFVEATRLTLDISGPFADSIPCDQGNLVVRAAQALASHLGKPQLGAQIHLQKKLPVASGIGGGSADAAAALRGLNQLWGAGLSLEKLAQIAASLGSDIPVCVLGGANSFARRTEWLRMGGRGEQLQWVKAGPTFDALLVNPGIAVSTREVFAKFDENDGLILANQLTNGSASKYGNDLTAAAISLAPEIGQVLQTLQELAINGHVQMCGSGATCFAGFSSNVAANNAAKSLRLSYPNWWVQVTRIAGA